MYFHVKNEHKRQTYFLKRFKEIKQFLLQNLNNLADRRNCIHKRSTFYKYKYKEIILKQLLTSGSVMVVNTQLDFVPVNIKQLLNEVEQDMRNY